MQHSQELTNVLKTDRGLLSLAVALIHNCCISPPPPPPPSPPPLCEGRDHGVGERTEEQQPGQERREDGRGRERLGDLVADRAFCCLLMKVNYVFVCRHNRVLCKPRPAPAAARCLRVSLVRVFSRATRRAAVSVHVPRSGTLPATAAAVLVAHGLNSIV